VVILKSCMGFSRHVTVLLFKDTSSSNRGCQIHGIERIVSTHHHLSPYVYLH